MRLVWWGIACMTGVWACSAREPPELGQASAPVVAKAELEPSTLSTIDRVGTSVAVAGTVAGVGSPGDSGNSGSVSVFGRDKLGSWTEVAVLVASDGFSGQEFAASLAFDGTSLLAGAPGGAGAVYSHELVSGIWSFTQKLVPGGAAAPESFGYEIALSADSLLVGCPDEDSIGQDGGAAYVFVRSGGNWAQQARLVASDGVAGARFGANVLLHDDYAFVGTRPFNNQNTVYVYSRSGTQWSETTKLVAIDNAFDFGAAMAVSNQSVMISATGSGIYEHSLGSWLFQGKILPPAPGFDFGAALAANASMLFIGRPGGFATLGSVAVYERIGTQWQPQQVLLPLLGSPEDRHGSAVALDGQILVSGAPHESATFPLGGAAYTWSIPLGTPCTTGQTCPSGFCANGVCCDSDCTAPCATCLANSGAAEDGVCGLTNAATYVPACAGYACSGSSDACPTSCDELSDCQTFFHCDMPSQKCVPVKQPGEPCTTSSECESNHCEDGVCCSSFCPACHACTKKLTGKQDGECAPAFAGTDPQHDCPQDLGFPSSCLADGTCDGVGNCRIFAPPTTPCGPTTCSAGQVSGMLCNGTGTCASGSASCGAYPCIGAVCSKTCAEDTDCAGIGFCSTAATCEPRRANGSPCDSPNQCISNLCQDGVCCNTLCEGQCEWCAHPSSLGNCIVVSGQPAPGRAPCDEGSATNPCSAASCDGVVGGWCNGFVGGDVECVAGTCTDGVATQRTTCDGKGQCPKPGTIECGAYACGSSACKTTCTNDDDCSAGNVCDVASGKCGAFSTCASEHVSRGPDGNTTDCTPYRCGPTGACLATCSSGLQCKAGHACSSNGDCVASSGGETSGCGCRTTARETPRSAWLLVLLVLMRRRDGSKPA